MAPKSHGAVLLLLNSTKMMDLATPAPPRLRSRDPGMLPAATELVAALRRLRGRRWREIMAVSDRLADRARVDLARWGEADNPSRPAWYAFSGLLYQALDPRTLDGAARRRASSRLRILSGLYGLLGPLDRVEAYRLEMGCGWAPGRSANLTAYWREGLTAAVNAELKDGEPVLTVASQEYMKALDAGALKGPVIAPVFKETGPDGSLKTAPVHAKRARGAIVRYALEVRACRPADLLGFGEMGWEATGRPPESGKWLFTRPDRR